MGNPRTWTYQIFASLQMLLMLTVICSTENCFDGNFVGEGQLNGQKTECLGFFQDVPGYLIYPENGAASNSSPIAVAFVSSELGGFRLIRDRELEEDCPSFFALDTAHIDGWASSSNREDLINSLGDVCFYKPNFVGVPGNQFSYRLVYKINHVTGENDATIYKPRKLAVSTPGGSEFIFESQNQELAQICSICSRNEIPFSDSSQLVESSNLTDVLNSLK